VPLRPVLVGGIEPLGLRLSSAFLRGDRYRDILAVTVAFERRLSALDASAT
jgi:hypothetical protein